MENFPLVLFVLAALYVVLFFVRQIPNLRDFDRLPDDPATLKFPQRRYPMSSKDALPIAIIMLVYGVVAFIGLGDMQAPQSFYQFPDSESELIIELDETTYVGGMMCYTGLYVGEYYVAFSADGESYTDVATVEHKAFKWTSFELEVNVEETKFIRITSSKKLEMGELAIYDYYGELVTVSNTSNCAALFDEQTLIPADGKTYLNSSYFDEIYHARTAYENVVNVKPYEISHPPLGKLIISIGIRIFGLTPFGWRFMGTLFGIIMLAFLYVFIKNLFGSTAIASCGTLLFAFDFMHYVQTRIATIDTYAVFFIIGMYFFMYRFVTTDADDPLIPRRRRFINLFFSGLFFGLGAASKWTVLYGGVGLALIWLLYWLRRGIELRGAGHMRRFTRSLLCNIALCLVFFLIIPAAIYYLSYWPYGTANGLSGFSMLTSREYFDIVIDNNKYMYSYHSGLVAEHPYSSSWYQWIVDARPILYYLNHTSETTKSTFAAFTNPVLTWAGLLSVISMGYLTIRKRDGRALFILIGYLSQLVPWLAVSRLTFAYHYFPCMIFITLAVCYVFNIARLSDFRWRRSVYGFTAVCLFLFILFYPVLSGLDTPTWYSSYFLRWISISWPF